MRKGVKVLFIVLILLGILVLGYIGLIIKGVLPSPFLDTSDLVCTRLIKFEAYTQETVITFRFDKWANLNSYEAINNLVYPTLEAATEYYEYTKPYVDSIELIEEDNKVKFFSSTIKNNKDSYHFEKTKQELKDEYEKNNSYICE